MRRLIFGATAIVTGLVAALGMVVRRRRAQHDDVLPLDPAPPLMSSRPAAREPAVAPSIEADFGSAADPPAAAKRKPRARRKPASTKRGASGTGKTGTGKTGTAKTGTAKTADAPKPAAAPAARPKRPTRVRTSPLATSAKAADSVEPAAGDEAGPADGS